MKTYKANKNHPFLKEGILVNEYGDTIEYKNINGGIPKYKVDWYDEVEPPRWRAERGEEYYFVAIDGEVTHNIDISSWTDGRRYNSGNYWKTEAQADEYARRCKALALEYHKELSI
jgi:hypothetical protein